MSSLFEIVEQIKLQFALAWEFIVLLFVTARFLNCGKTGKTKAIFLIKSAAAQETKQNKSLGQSVTIRKENSAEKERK